MKPMAAMLTHYGPVMPLRELNYFRGSLQFSIVTIKKISPTRNLKFHYLDIFQSLKSRISMEKILTISLKLNFTPNTSGCYGLSPIFP